MRYIVNTFSNATCVTLRNVTTQGERLVELQEAARFPSLAAFARQAGVEPGTARQHVNRGSVPSDAAARYIRAANFTGATTEWLLYGTGQGPRRADNAPILRAPLEPETEQGPAEKLPHALVTRIQETAGPPDIPLWASAAAGDDGAMILVPDPIDYLRRSERMLRVRNPFAFNIIGDSMSPAIEHGDQGIINPSIVARPGMNCVFIEEGPDGMFALVKRLIRPASDVWHVRQFNPAKDFTLSRRKWPRVHPIAEIRKAGMI